VARFTEFSDDELVRIAEALSISWRPGGFEMGPESDDLPMLLDLVNEMHSRGDELFGDLGGERGVQALIRRAEAAG
jgi:hypothetical protein